MINLIAGLVNMFLAGLSVEDSPRAAALNLVLGIANIVVAVHYGI